MPMARRGRDDPLLALIPVDTGFVETSWIKAPAFDIRRY